jgi:enoyl-CoA hydratase/carnithine racemase
VAGLVATEERGRVVYLRVPRAAAPDEAERLAWAVADACTRIEERQEPLCAVALTGGRDAFLLAPPEDAASWRRCAGAAAVIAAALDRLSPPVLAVVAGEAVGPAWEIALACDLRIAAEAANLGSPDLRVGLMPAAGATQRLPRLAGTGIALRLLLLAEVLPAQEALPLGLVEGCVPVDRLDEAAEGVLDGLRAAAPIALAYAKEAIRRSVDLPLDTGLRLEADLATLLQTTADRAEGIASFLERRTPRFEGT